MTILSVIRTMNKLIRATQNERIFTERLFKKKQIYNYIEIK